MRHVQWLHISLSVPDEWEITRHAVDPGTGRLMFVDRRHQRLVLSWAGCATPPELKQLMSDARSRDRERHPNADFEPVSRRGAWTFYRWSENGMSVTRAGFYDRLFHRWIEMVMTWPGGLFDPSLEKRLIEQCTVVNPHDRSRWRAFDIDVDVPASWRLGAARVKPADVLLRFSGRRLDASVHCLKAPEGWFDGSLEGFLKKELTDSPATYTERTYQGHPACESRSREQGFRLRWVAGGRRNRFDMAWLCPGAHALFHVTTVAAPSVHAGTETIAVRCCGTEK